jgi:hypothetical protein
MRKLSRNPFHGTEICLGCCTVPDQAAPSQDAGSRKLTWFFQGMGLAALMLIGAYSSGGLEAASGLWVHYMPNHGSFICSSMRPFCCDVRQVASIYINSKLIYVNLRQLTIDLRQFT